MAATQRGIAGREQFGHAIALMQRYAPLAVNTLAKVITDADAPASAQVAATTTRVEMDRDTNELEHLAAAIVLVKGECDAVDEG